jgi:hypothetical protein
VALQGTVGGMTLNLTKSSSSGANSSNWARFTIMRRKLDV